MRTQGLSSGIFPPDCCARVRFFVGRFRADDFLLAKLTRKIFFVFFWGGKKGRLLSIVISGSSADDSTRLLKPRPMYSRIRSGVSVHAKISFNCGGLPTKTCRLLVNCAQKLKWPHNALSQSFAVSFCLYAAKTKKLAHVLPWLEQQLFSYKKNAAKRARLSCLMCVFLFCRICIF